MDHGVLLQLCSIRRPSIPLIRSTIWCRFWLISAPLLSESNQRKTEARRENCSTAASQSGCVHLRSIERARYATKHVDRACVCDTDSDYVMKRPSRCWLGAVPRYWDVVASCFQFVSFAKNTSAPLAPHIFNRFSYSFFVFLLLNLSAKRCLRFFLFRLKLYWRLKEDSICFKRLFSDVFTYLTNFRFKI